MSARTVYSLSMTVFAFLVGFYALLSFAVFFGETNKELFVPVFATLCAGVIVWTAVTLWRGGNAYFLTAASTLLVAGTTGYLVLPTSASLSPLYIIIFASFLLSLALLGALLTQHVKENLRN